MNMACGFLPPTWSSQAHVVKLDAYATFTSTAL